ncbi:unnamed protein product [Symbiodinium natans]|uniref:Uncharacterized protein n=1 Tax=Symbiodinium natans TaxID=878477 RepID=A0A812I3H9_9DINO|nr:unnamed protein product [Symbiodinium natans]
MEKTEVIGVVRSVLAQNKVQLKRPGPGGAGSVHRFHGHCLRVSGAQMLSRFGVRVSTIMLIIGRWGSKAIERYIQDAELEGFDLGQADLDPGRKLAKRQKHSEDDSVQRQTTAQIADVEVRLQELAAKVEALQQRPLLVIGKKAHIRDCAEGSKLPRLWTTKCGCWNYGGSAFLRADEPGEKSRCRRCFPQEDASDTESESSAESDRPESSSASGSSECDSEDSPA